MAGAVVEAVPAYGEDLQKRTPIAPRSCLSRITSPQASLSVTTGTAPKQQGQPFLAPRPPWPTTPKSSQHIKTQETENHRSFGERSTHLYSCASGTGPSTSATPEFTSTGTKQSSNTCGRHARGKGKRERQKQDDSESDDMSNPPEKSSKKKACSTLGSTPKLACPFFVCCPHKHLRCGFSSFGKISHVAQHLERQHYESVKCDCPICGVNFDTLSDRTAHLRGEQRCPRRNPRLCAVTTERLEEIKSISADRLKSQSGKWIDIYKVIAGDSMPEPVPWCTDPLKYLLCHFISFVLRSGDHSFFNVREDYEAHMQTVNNYLADEQEPLESTSMIPPSLLDSNFPGFSANSISSMLETPIDPFQLHRAAVATPVSTTAESHRANMTSSEVMSDQAHELGHDDVTSYTLDPDDSLIGFIGFSEQHDGSLT
ncbi:hypothetical protein FHL15_002754 [Xylaria flabelliformis]|uniref:C2H2-type domain-containing protein n=1 Tax=Xylaria flabelliformis TaxID=2512241 RepID=A0A553I8H3_9PEZI|nr:hypothetical protein FHL15_002754 [Xylaria flabelliformis]